MAKKRQASREIARRIREARKLSGLNQQEVEVEIGKAKNAVSRWERAEVQIDATDLGKLARLFKVSSDWLLGIDDEVEMSEVEMSEVELVRDYRQASPALRAATLAGLQAGLRMERDPSG
ncbi:MAG: helix-turn-helix transcriptional regulator [Dehalococcoidia bacterium]|nr:helix-turn-helix transcriptional regulator [Dehalococcoidia bacterium]